jgi:heme A synthase
MTLFNKPKRFWWDVLERTGMTFAAAFIMFWIADTDIDETFLSGDWQTTIHRLGEMALWQKALIAGFVAVGTVVKTLVGGLIGNNGTASILPQTKDPATPPPVPPN